MSEENGNELPVNLSKEVRNITGLEVVLCMQFNQDFSHLAVGTNLGCKVLAILPPKRPVKVYENVDLGPVGLIAMQYKSSAVAIVTQNQHQQP